MNPSEVWLRDEIDGAAYFPLQNGNFDLLSQGASRYATLVVEGPTVPVSTPARNNLPRNQLQGASMSLSSTPGNHSGTPLHFSAPSTSSSFQSVIAPRRVPSFSLKVIKANMHRIGKKVEFQPHSQTFIELVDSTANVEHILGVIQRRWGSDYILVTQDGLQLEESPATQGNCIALEIALKPSYTRIMQLCTAKTGSIAVLNFILNCHWNHTKIELGMIPVGNRHTLVFALY